MSRDDDVAPPATLVIELPDGLQRVSLTDGATLGRDERNDVPIDHPTVSRQHARIARVGETWRFEDLGSRNGTRGGVTPGHPFDLIDGAPLRIGRVRAWFFTGDVPTEWSPPDTMPTGGKLVRCRCGHVGWAPSFVAGMAVKCRACKRPITVEDDVAPATAAAICAGCRDAVSTGQPSHVCPGCGATMHADCYAELRGCATYGCDHVNELATAHDEAAAQPVDTFETPTHDDRWTLALLALVGLPLFGAPAILFAVYGMIRRRSWRTIAIALAAGIVGAAASAIVWPRLMSTGGAAW